MSADGPHDNDPGAPPGSDGPWSPLGALFGAVNATRRSVIASLLAAVGTAAGRKSFAAAPFAAPVGTMSPDALSALKEVPGQNFRIRVVRPNDFLYFEVEFVNLAPVGKPITSMRRVDQRRAGYLIVHHQAQAITEQAYQEFDPTTASTMPSRDAGQSFPVTAAEQAALQKAVSTGGKEPTPAPPLTAASLIAGESRVVFITPNIASFPFTLAQLLEAFGTWEMNLDPSAQPAPVDFILPPELILKFMQGAAQSNSSTATITIGQFKQIYNRLPRPGEPLTVPLSVLQNTPKVISPFGAPATTNNAGGTLSTTPQVTLPPVPPHVPAATVTALELPYRLIQSPLPQSGWRHETDAERVNHNNRYELWHTRLGARSSDGTTVDDTAAMPVRAIWSPDYPVNPPQEPPFTMALDGLDRQMLVKLMAGYDQKNLGGTLANIGALGLFKPKPAIARRLMLSALGGWLLEDGDWSQRPPNVDLTQWNHRAAMARDYYVRVVYAGFLYPFGHAASLVKVTERKFEDRSDNKGRVAVLRQRFYIVVRQKTRNYQHPSQAYQGRDLPFVRIDCVTVTTPDIAPPQSDIEPNKALAREVFWPKVADPENPSSGVDFKFQMIGFDHLGRAIPFATPALFISENRNNSQALKAIHAAYNSEDVKGNGTFRRAPPLNGAMTKVAQDADTPDPDKGDTNVPLDTVGFIGADPIAAVAATAEETNPAQFFPGTDVLKVKLPAVQKILGTNAPVLASISKAFIGTDPTTLIPPGFDPNLNPGQVFLDLEKAATSALAAGPTDKGGGLLTPDLTPQSLSRTLGAVAAQAVAGSDFAQGNFDPKQFLPDMKLLGILPISDIIGQILSGLGAVPKLINQELPDQIIASFTIDQQELQPFPPGSGDKGLFQPNAPADDGGAQTSVLHIVSQIVVPRPAVGISGGQPSAGAPTADASIDGKLTNFQINLFGCIVISFDQIAFSGKPGQKPDVTIGINKDHGVLFKGPLEFVNELKNYIPANGFTDPPSLSVTPAGITASYSLALPSVTVGIMSLQNITIGAGFDLPFDGNPPTARFNFAEKQNPFNLTVSLLGGGGFLSIEVSAQGVRMIEAQLEFGAFAAIDLGVASGSVYVKGGFHFFWQGATDGTTPGASGMVELDAFVELGGHLSILGLISVSLVFHVDLSYKEIDSPKSSELVGQATLTVEVDVLFFSKSVSVSVEKRFAGSARDPRFIDFIPDPQTWQSYCEAFAP